MKMIWRLSIMQKIFCFILLLDKICGVVQTVKIGGILRFFFSNGMVDPSGLEFTGSAIMALKEINNNNVLLPNTTLLFSIEIPRPLYLNAVQSAERLSSKDFNNTGVNLVVGPTFVATTKASAQIFAQYNLVQVGWNSDSELSYKENYPYFLRTAPSDSFQAHVLAEAIYYKFNWKFVAVFSSDDYFGSSSYLEFSSRCDELGITILTSYTFIKGSNDLSSITLKAKSSLATIFIILADAYDTATLLVNGYDSGIFHADTQIVGTSFAATDDLIKALPSHVNKVSILKGFIALIPAVDLTSPKITDFMKRWKAQNNTVINHPDGTQTCNNKKDDDGGNYLYKGKPNDEGANYPYVCTGIDYSKYSYNASSMNNLTFYVYDTVYAVARALHTLIYEQGAKTVTGESLRNILLNNISFEGLTGNITFAKGKGGYENYGSGDRRTGAYHRLVNFQECVDVSGGVSYPCLKTIGSWHSENGFRSCWRGKYSDCAEIVYNTADNSKPIDWPDPILVPLSTMAVVLLFLMSILCLIVIIGFILMVSLFRKNITIKSSQPSMLYFILYGGLLGVGYIIVNTFTVTITTCIVGQWLAHLCYGTVFGTLVLKTWRVHRLFNSGLKRVKVSTTFINNVVWGTISILCAYLTLMTVVSEAYLSNYKTVNKRATYLQAQCNSTLPVMSTILFSFEALALVYGARLCWLTKGLPDDINESAYIASAIYSIFFVCLVVFPAKYLLSLSPDTSHLIVSIGFFFGLLSAILSLFVPKAIKLATTTTDGKMSDPNPPSNATSNYESGNRIVFHYTSMLKENPSKHTPNSMERIPGFGGGGGGNNNSGRGGSGSGGSGSGVTEHKKATSPGGGNHHNNNNNNSNTTTIQLFTTREEAKNNSPPSTTSTTTPTSSGKDAVSNKRPAGSSGRYVNLL